MKRAQELRVDEFSVQELRLSHQTIQRLTSHMQEMQEQMNSMIDSGEFQELESNHSGRLSYVPSQPAGIPITVGDCLTFPVSQQVFHVHVLCLAATNACLLIHGINLNYRETFLAIHVLCSIHHRHHVKEFFTLRHQVLQVRFQCMEVQGHLTQEVKNEFGSTIPMPMSARRPSTLSLLFPVDNPQNSMVTKKRAKIGTSIRQNPYIIYIFHVRR